MSNSDDWGSVPWILAAVAVIWFVRSIWFSKFAYELYYSVSSSELSIAKQPHDCDFMRAPIGEKDCHYKRVVSTVEIGTSTTTNKPVMSFDGGKTWSGFTPDPGTTVPQDATVTNVSVTWEKIED